LIAQLVEKYTGTFVSQRLLAQIPFKTDFFFSGFNFTAAKEEYVTGQNYFNLV